MFVDEAVIEVQSGNGGSGCVSFRREKYIPKGGPDGGDGGKGADVYLLADPQISTLMDYSGRHHWKAGHGQPGTSKQRHGRNAEDLTLLLPPGTMVYDNESGELCVDLRKPGQRHLIAAGGRGGFGNEHFKSATHQTPDEFTPGEPGVTRHLRLELKLLADVGLIGKPNAGKSTLLSRLTRARPKIANYPFTTLTPQLGICEIPVHGRQPARRLVLADIPGLIEHAHRGEGLGTRFLRHIERTGVLVHLVEIMPDDGSDPCDNYQMIRRELKAYSSELSSKPELLVLTKMDLVHDAKTLSRLTRSLQLAAGNDQPVYPISAATGQGMPALLEACWQLARKTKKSFDSPAWALKDHAGQ